MTNAPSTEKCLFCPRDADSGEHLFPAWLRGMFQTDRRPSFTTVSARFENLGEETRELSRTRRRHPRAVANIKHYVVCRECNNGWMSVLENSVIPILSPIIRGEHLSLNQHELRTIERWVAKTTIVNEIGYPGQITIPEPNRQIVKDEGTLPSYWQIFIGQGISADGQFGSSYSSASMTPVREGPPVYASCTVLLIGTLVILVLVSPNLALHFNEKSGFGAKLRRVSPNMGVLRWPPEETLTDSDVLLLTEALGRAISGPEAPSLGLFR